ncbi:hypothetical protein HHUSO_G23341 [Huso huso]|uniref:Uncharacterized protein n=1 Tax=Huso huso TaxID=61971 RepID=A0ABR0YW58_HUSHU
MNAFYICVILSCCAGVKGKEDYGGTLSVEIYGFRIPSPVYWLMLQYVSLFNGVCIVLIVIMLLEIRRAKKRLEMACLPRAGHLIPTL